MTKKKQERKSKHSTVDEKSTITTGGGDLFNNPMTRAALAAMSDEEKQHYKDIGEQMYGHLNFEDAEVLNNLPVPMAEATAYLEQQIQSGLHPSMMDENEKALLTEVYGEKWFEKWGYSVEDLDRIFTLKRNYKKKSL